ncbi:MAG: hypothetical protein Ct9H300mP1_32420 [Planctomycetaceae bacterium]|nr:MAG: hypothetical protein Ct9H300mP1_32420 [Planctomycetaceae bacterium]
MTDFAAEHAKGHDYEGFLGRHASDEDRERWQTIYDRVTLTESRAGGAGVLRTGDEGAGAGRGLVWRLREPVPDLGTVQSVVFTDPGSLPRSGREPRIDRAVVGQRRPPGAGRVFLSEDDHLCGIFGDRTLAKYRAMAAGIDASLVPVADDGGRTLLEQATDEWLNEFERMQLMMRTSGRLRQLHGD